MPILEDIANLEESVQKILEAAGNYRAIDDFGDFLRRELAELVPEVAADLDPETLRAAVRRIIEEGVQQLDGITAEALDDVRLTIDRTLRFYEQQGTILDRQTVLAAVQRSADLRMLDELFRDNLESMEDELFQGTMQALTEALSSGTFDRSAIQERIVALTDAQQHHARTNSRLLVSGYNRVARLEMANSAGLQHALYYGQIASNTRPFCGLMVGKIMSREQIAALDNGQGLDVLTFCGGYNCIHSWLWLDLEWHEALKKDLYNGDITVQGEGSSRIVVPS